MRATLGLMVIGSSSSCGAATSETPVVFESDCLLRNVTVTPGTVNMRTRDTTLLHGSGTSSGCNDQRVTVTWQVIDSTIVTIVSSTDSTAIPVARGVGSTTIIATAVQDPTIKGAASITVTP